MNVGRNKAPDGSSGAAIAVAALFKRYGAITAVRGASFEVGTGSIFGLLGPNGAGKTTTLECIVGLREADSGSIRINGVDLGTHSIQARQFVGAQLQAARLQPKITPRQGLDLFGSFYLQRFPVEELLRRFDLQDKADAPFASLSGGQRQRLFLALALVNRPTVLVLDEPTAGLDPQARRGLRALIKELRSEGRTILLSTHDLEEAAQLCDEVAIMDRGRIVALGPPDELIGRAKSPTRVVVRTAPPLAGTVVSALPDVAGADCCEDGWILETSVPTRLVQALVRLADESGSELVDVHVRRPSLEDVFIEVTGHSWPGGQIDGEVA